METSRTWRRRWFGYSEADLRKALAEAEAALAAHLAPLTSELAALKSELGVVADLVGQRKRRIAELEAVKAKLEAANQESGIIWPHLSHLAKQHLQEVQAELGAQRAAADEQVAAVEARLARERADFLSLLLRLQTLAEGILSDGAPGAGQSAAALAAQAVAVGLMPAEPEGDGWRPGTIGPSRQVPEPADPAASAVIAPTEVAAPAGVTPEPDAPPPSDATPPADRTPSPDVAPLPGAADSTQTAAAAEPSAPTDVRAQLDAAAVAMGIRTDLWKMLAGKAVGADLMLPNGTLLARAGTPITEQLVDRARSANLLADLILDMTFAAEEH